MKTTAGQLKRIWVIACVVLLAILDIALVGAAYAHGHPDVQGTPGPIPTFSSRLSPANSPAITSSPHISAGQQ